MVCLTSDGPGTLGEKNRKLAKTTTRKKEKGGGGGLTEEDAGRSLHCDNGLIRPQETCRTMKPRLKPGHHCPATFVSICVPVEPTTRRQDMVITIFETLSIVPNPLPPCPRHRGPGGRGAGVWCADSAPPSPPAPIVRQPPPLFPMRQRVIGVPEPRNYAFGRLCDTRATIRCNSIHIVTLPLMWH